MEGYPYSILKQNERSYEILLLRDQQGNTFTDIAKEYEISGARVRQTYYKMKAKQSQLYINHLSVVLGYKNTLQIRSVFDDAYQCYQDLTYACAYLEKKYQDSLTEYRKGEPGMPARFIKHMPPFKPKLSRKTVARIVEMREIQKMSYIAIAKELRITAAKAKHTYDWFYHEKVLELIRERQEKARNYREKMEILAPYIRGHKTPKKYYDELTKNRHEEPKLI